MQGQGSWQQSQLVGASQDLSGPGKLAPASQLLCWSSWGRGGVGTHKETIKASSPRALPPLQLEPQRGQEVRSMTPKPGSQSSADLNVTS